MGEIRTSRVALVSSGGKLSEALQEHITRNLGRPALPCSFENAADHLARDTDGVLLLVAEGPADEEAIVRQVQDINLQKLPPILVVVSKTPFQSPVKPFVQQFVWPEEAAALVLLLKSHAARGIEFGRREESLEDVLARRLLAQTPSLLPMVERIALAAKHDVTVLLNGETGTGKTFIARLIHEHSVRKENRFLTVPCGALSANLVESEFFGHVKGAFTGADRPKIGKFAAVGKGTLLLDEIDTLGLEQQATLLRVIETGEFEPVGSIETEKCHGRLIVASNINLEEAVEGNKFRPDLYFRLNVMSFHLPPLRERVQDIAPLARGMAARFNRKFHKNLYDISAEALAALESYPWPGNIRQLENAIQHAVLVSSGPEVLVSHLPPAIAAHAVAAGPESNGNGSAKSPETLHHQRDLIERNLIQRALVNNGFSRARAAQALGISRVTLYKKMKKYGLMDPPAA